jgi:cell division ATPase FtsA
MSLKFWKKKGKPFLVLDIGTEAVKSIIAEGDGDKIKVLASAVNYFKNCDSNFLVEDFEVELFKKTVIDNLEELYREFALSPSQKTVRLENLPIFVALPPNIVRAEVIEIEYQKGSSSKISQEEKKKICSHILDEAKRKISTLVFDVEYIRLNIIENKIEGYPISDIINCRGAKLNFKVLAIFSSKIYLENVRKVFSCLKLNISQIIHLSETIPNFLKNNKINDGIFVDVGAKITQVFFFKEGKIETINNLEIGGCNFSNKLAENFGLDRDSAKSLKENYSSNSLTPESSERIKKILSSEKNTWKGNFSYLKTGKLQSFSIYLFGGGSMLPEIKEVFLKEKVILPKNIKKIIISNRELKNSQIVPCLLTSIYVQENI